MKKWIIAVLVMMLFVSIAPGFAAEKPRLGVLRFTNNTSAGWWSGSTGRDLQDMLIAELASIKSFSVLERKELDAVMAEQNLGASGRVSKATRSKLGNITGAKYLVAATVSAFETNTSGGGGGIHQPRQHHNQDKFCYYPQHQHHHGKRGDMERSRFRWSSWHGGGR